jgi:AraC-like DNA-binding protein
MSRSIYFQLTQLSMPAILDAYAKAFGTITTGNRFVYPPADGEGFLQGFLLPSGLEAVVFKYHYYNSFHAQHLASDTEKYMIWFDIAATEQEAYSFGVGTEKQVVSGDEIKIGVLFSSLHNFFNIRPKGIKGFGLCIILNKEILDNICPPALWKSSLEWYRDLSLKQLQTVKITDAEKSLIEAIHQIVLYNNNHLKLEVHLYQLLELYFLRLLNAFHKIGNKINLTSQEMEAAAFIELKLNRYIGQLQPNYAELEKETGLNRQMLDKLVKKVYHCTLITYFNKLKIQSTYAEVVGNNKDIKDIAYDLGYSNPSNFIAAFKKEYGTTPALLRESMLYQ